LPQSRKRHTARRTHARAALPQRQQARAGAEKRKRIVAAVVVFALVAAGAAYFFAPGLRGGGAGGAQVTTPSGLKYTDLVVGTGPSPRPGQTAVVHYTGTLANGTKFDSSRDRGQPYEFVLRSNPPSVIEGWDEGVATMKVGGRRRLVVPPALGYGARPKSGIPPNSTLDFDVELLDVK
jgi:peptidylprolyl isomerase